MSQLEILKEALEGYMGMWGCSLQKSGCDDCIECSCNGYIVGREEAEAVATAKKCGGFWE